MEISYRKIILSNQWHCNAFDLNLKFKFSNSWNINVKPKLKFGEWERPRDCCTLRQAHPLPGPGLCLTWQSERFVWRASVSAFAYSGYLRALLLGVGPCRKNQAVRPAQTQSSKPSESLFHLRFLRAHPTEKNRKISQGERDLQYFAKRTFCPEVQLLESIIENWGKKTLAKTTPKKEKTRKREAIKQLAACHLELQRKGAAKKKSRE